ncbi:hypothetical protein AAFC00_002533 [Neodothiora populina]|uniref:Mediator of RNA polymerase II transcription subunit 18 n=1 Tax=Neodothiora populina TaxID=2781224 RepID=A0ABR3P7H4_9PEZI
MHELLLYGQVPVTRYEQVLKILTGVAAMQPRVFYERQLIYKPLRSSEEAKPNKRFPSKPVKPVPLAYHQVLESLVEDDFGKEIQSVALQSAQGNSEAVQRVTVKVLETPEPETKTFVLRPANELDASQELLQKLADPASYSFVTELFVEGHHLVHQNVLLTLSRMLKPDQAEVVAPSTVLPAIESLKLLEPSGAFILEARVRIEDRTKQSLLSSASDELNAFRDLMRGSVDMRVPDRLALDTRVK